MSDMAMAHNESTAAAPKPAHTDSALPDLRKLNKPPAAEKNGMEGEGGEGAVRKAEQLVGKAPPVTDLEMKN